MFIMALFLIAKVWKQPKYPSTYEWIKKICTQTDIYTHDGILLSHKKRNSAIIKSVDGPRGYYAQ